MGEPVKYTIEPLRGIGPVEFGMTPKKVSAVLGPPTKTKDDQIMKAFLEWRNGIEFRYLKGRLEDVTFPRGSTLFYREHEVFSTRDIVERLKADSPDWDDSGHYVNFPSLGLCLGGFGRRRIPEGKFVTAYGSSRVQFYRGFIHA